MKQTNNVILKICNNSRYIQTEQVTNKINQYTYTKTVNNKSYQ